jgi:adenylate cyclase
MVHSGREATTPAAQPDLFTQVTQVLHAVSVARPLLVVVDDLQWADGGTAALLFHLGRRLAGSRILLACACRPEALGPQSGLGTDNREGGGAAALGVGTVLREICRERGNVLIDLDKVDGRAFVEAYVDSEPNRLRMDFRQTLYNHTGGNPLFTVELLRGFERTGALVRDEAGQWVEAPGLDWERWPPQVEAVIAGHLADLPDEDRALLQTASVQGEQFAAEVAARVLHWDEDVAVRRLSGPLRTRYRLVEATSLDRLPSSGQRLSRYRFRHALLQRSAYRSLDEVARARLHEATGRALEAIYAAEGEHFLAPAPQLARHFEAAGMPLEAARYHLEAGRWAARLVAYDEAIAHLERGLALLEGVAASRERLRLELRLCIAIGAPMMLLRGWQAPAHRRVLERLSDLVQHPDLQDEPQRLTALTVLALSTGWSADPEYSGWVGEQLLSLAPLAGSGQASTEVSGQTQEGDRQTLMLGHWALGLSHWLRGQPVPAREHLDRAVGLYDPKANRALGGLVVADPGVMARAMLGAVQWQMGYPDQARACLRQAVVQAQALEQPSSLAFAHFMAVMITSAVGHEVATALSHCQDLQQLSETSLVYNVWLALLAALAQAPTKDSGPGGAQAITQAVEALSTWQAAGSGAGYAGLLLLEAELFARAGQAEKGLEAIDQAQEWIERTGVRPTEPEAWRMRGELLLLAARGATHLTDALHLASPDEAEACFHRALALAREQGSRWWELGAAASLARLWQAQGRRHEARELLAGIYAWFTEGFDTVDLVEAKALLAELA